MLGLLRGKKGLVLGVSNEKSLGWAVACAWRRHGAQVAIGIQNDRFRSKVEKLTAEWKEEAPLLVECDVNDDESMWRCRERVSEHFEEELHMVMHAVAFSPRECLHGDGKPYGKEAGRLGGAFLHTSRANFVQTMETSVFSFILTGNVFSQLLARGADSQGSPASLMALTFDGSTRVVPGYNLMGPAKGALESSARYMAIELGEAKVRVNTISAGPVNTLSARGLPKFNELRKQAESTSPLMQPLTGDAVGDAAVFLASSLSTSITGQNIFVDNGYSVVRG